MAAKQALRQADVEVLSVPKMGAGLPSPHPTTCRPEEEKQRGREREVRQGGGDSCVSGDARVAEPDPPRSSVSWHPERVASDDHGSDQGGVVLQEGGRKGRRRARPLTSSGHRRLRVGGADSRAGPRAQA